MRNIVGSLTVGCLLTQRLDEMTVVISLWPQFPLKSSRSQSYKQHFLARRVRCTNGADPYHYKDISISNFLLHIWSVKTKGLKQEKRQTIRYTLECHKKHLQLGQHAPSGHWPFGRRYKYHSKQWNFCACTCIISILWLYHFYSSQ